MHPVTPTHSIYRDLPNMLEMEWTRVCKMRAFKWVTQPPFAVETELNKHSVCLAPQDFNLFFFHLALQNVESLPLRLLKVNAQDVSSDFFLYLLKKAPELRKLEVTNIQGDLFSQLMGWVIAYCPKIESIELSNSFGSDRVVLKQPMGLNSLARLCLNQVSNNFDLEGWDRFFNTAGENLRILNLFNCRNLSNEHVVSVARNCPQLECLNIGDCFNLTSRILVDLQRHETAMTALHIDGLYLETKDIRDSSEFLSQLKHLSLSGSCVYGLALEALAGYSSKLEHINLSRCTGLDSKAFQQFIRKNPQIKVFDIREIPLSEEALDHLQRDNPSVQIVHEYLISKIL